MTGSTPGSGTSTWRHTSRVWCHHCQTSHVLRIRRGVRINQIACPRCGVEFAANAVMGRAWWRWPWERTVTV